MYRSNASISSRPPKFRKPTTERDLKVYGWIFDIHSGKLIDLNINFTEILKDITKIYKISN